MFLNKLEPKEFFENYVHLFKAVFYFSFCFSLFKILKSEFSQDQLVYFYVKCFRKVGKITKLTQITFTISIRLSLYLN